MNLTRNRVEKYKDVDRDENRHTFLKLPDSGSTPTSGAMGVSGDRRYGISPALKLRLQRTPSSRRRYPSSCCIKYTIYSHHFRRVIDGMRSSDYTTSSDRSCPTLGTSTGLDFNDERFQLKDTLLEGALGALHLRQVLLIGQQISQA